MKLATDGQKVAIRQIIDRLTSLGSVSFGLLENIETLTYDEATFLITNYRPRRSLFNSSLEWGVPKAASVAQRKLLLSLFYSAGLSNKEQTELIQRSGARFLETLSIDQADWCIRHLTQLNHFEKNAGHA